MARLLVGTDAEQTSERLVAYLEGIVGEDDIIYAVNSLPGGDQTHPEDVADGEDALDIIEEGLSDQTTVESHQYIRGNEPVEDLLEAADEHDVEEFVVGIRKQSPVGKMVFGSTAQNLLLETDLPVRCVPLVSD